MSMELLPDDLLANVLGRLPPCDLAASCCARKRWCDVIDGRRLLRSDLLPLRLDGFFCLSVLPDPQAHFFASRSTARRVSGSLDFVDEFHRPGILDHCNGLLLLWELVVNPATRQSVALPPFPDPCVAMDGLYERRFLAFDPAVSPHFEVVSVPFLRGTRSSAAAEECEWPLPSYTTHVFSSRTWKWEKRTFVREGEVTGTSSGEMRSDWTTRHRHAVYRRGTLYVHCQDYSVMRITLSNDKYQTIKSPAEKNQGVVYLGKSEKGVYSALLWKHNGLPWCRVWFLNESGGHMQWILKSDISLQVLAQTFPFDNERNNKAWIVNYRDDINEAWEDADDSEWISMTVSFFTKPKVKKQHPSTTMLFSSDSILTKRLPSFWYHGQEQCLTIGIARRSKSSAS